MTRRGGVGRGRLPLQVPPRCPGKGRHAQPYSRPQATFSHVAPAKPCARAPQSGEMHGNRASGPPRPVASHGGHRGLSLSPRNEQRPFFMQLWKGHGERFVQGRAVACAALRTPSPSAPSALPLGPGHPGFLQLLKSIQRVAASGPLYWDAFPPALRPVADSRFSARRSPTDGLDGILSATRRSPLVAFSVVTRFSPAVKPAPRAGARPLTCCV